MISLLLLRQIAELFIIIILMGFLLVKTGLLKAEDSKSLSVVTLYIIMPCVIINSFQVEYTNNIKHGLILAFIAAIFIHVVLILLGKGLEHFFYSRWLKYMDWMQIMQV